MATVRERVLGFATSALSHGRPVPLGAGGRVLRRGRWVIIDTTGPELVAVEVHPQNGAAIYVGPPAVIRNIVPARLRAAWIAGDSDETDDDP